MHAHPVVRGNLGVRVSSLALGLLLFAVGIVGILESKLGLSPWDVLNQGIARHTPLSFGEANIAVALVVLVGAWRLRAPIGFGTVANAILVGTFIDLILRLTSVELLSHDALAIRVVLLFGGIALIGIGTAFYIGASLGAGPRDSLMLELTRRGRYRVRLVRTGIEACALAAGFALGGTVGIGTLAFALGIGPAVEASFWLLGHSPLAAAELQLLPDAGL